MIIVGFKELRSRTLRRSDDLEVCGIQSKMNNKEGEPTPNNLTAAFCPHYSTRLLPTLPSWIIIAITMKNVSKPDLLMYQRCVITSKELGMCDNIMIICWCMITSQNERRWTLFARLIDSLAEPETAGPDRYRGNHVRVDFVDMCL